MWRTFCWSVLVLAIAAAQEGSVSLSSSSRVRRVTFVEYFNVVQDTKIAHSDQEPAQKSDAKSNKQS